MKRFYQYAFLGALVFVLSSHHTNADNEASIKLIRQWYGEIQGDASLKKTVYTTSEDEEPHRVTVTRYSTSKGELRKLHVSYGGEHGGENVTYYYKVGGLFFVYLAYESWHFTGEKRADGMSETMNMGAQSRYYFVDGKCIKALGKRVQSKNADLLPTLLKKAKNEPIVHHDTAPEFLKKSRSLAQIRSNKDLERYLSKRD